MVTGYFDCGDGPTLRRLIAAKLGLSALKNPNNESKRGAIAAHCLSAVLSGSFDQPQDDQQDHRADEGVDDRGDDAAADHSPICGSSQPAIRAPTMPTMMSPISPKSAALDDHAGKPAGNRADDQPNNDALRTSPDFLSGKQCQQPLCANRAALKLSFARGAVSSAVVSGLSCSTHRN